MLNIQKYYYILPILFIITILIFLFDEYSKEKTLNIHWSDNFKATFTLSERDEKSLIDPNILPTIGLQPQSVAISIFSVTFLLEKHHVAPNKHTLFLKKVIPNEKQNGFSLLLTTTRDEVIDIGIIFYKDDTIEEYIITIKNYSNTDIVLPFSLIIGSNTTISSNQIDIFSQSLNTYLTVSPNIEIKENSFHVQSSNGIIRISNKKDNKMFNTTAIDMDTIQAPPVSLNVAIQEYIDKSYYAWIFSRYQRSTGMWRYPHSIYTFNEDALVATYSEAMQRNELSQHKLFLERIALLHTPHLSWKSLPIHGTNTIGIHTISASTHLIHTLQDKNQEMLETYLLDHSFLQHAYTFYQDDIKAMILQALKSMLYAHCSPELAASLLYQSHSSLWQEANMIIQSNKDILTLIVLNNFVSVYDTINDDISFTLKKSSFLDNENIVFFLSNSNNQLDSIATLLGAKYFVTQKEQSLVQFGTKLMYDLLAQSDDTGFLPRWFIVNKDTIVPSGYIAPESIYSLLKGNKYYPHISIDTSLRILSVVPISYTYQNNRLVLSAPTIAPNITTYLFIWNIRAPARIVAFDAVWKGNYNLDGLLRGAQYNANTHTIMIKNKSKNTQETIRVQY